MRESEYDLERYLLLGEEPKGIAGPASPARIAAWKRCLAVNHQHEFAETLSALRWQIFRTFCLPVFAVSPSDAPAGTEDAPS